MKKYIFIKADYNDGDYVSNLREVSDETLEKIFPVIKAIKEFKPYPSKNSTFKHYNNYPNGEACRDDLGELSAEQYYVDGGRVDRESFELFDNLTPGAEYGIHTVVEVRILEIASDEKLI